MNLNLPSVVTLLIATMAFAAPAAAKPKPSPRPTHSTQTQQPASPQQPSVPPKVQAQPSAPTYQPSVPAPASNPTYQPSVPAQVQPSSVSFPPGQLQKKFKHAVDFGINTNYSKASEAQFQQAIQDHINSGNVKAIAGTYRKDPVMHYVNQNTGLNVITKQDGTFVSAWKLNQAQLANVLGHGGL